MKSFFCLLIISSLASSCFSQFKAVEINHYILPEFTRGTVLMKSGVSNETNLNYNSLTEEMIFENNDIKLAMSNMREIDTVFIQGHIFFPLNGKFVELIYNSKCALYAEHKCKLIDPGKPAAYGGTSQTSATDTYSSFLSNGRLYELNLPDGYKTEPYTEYWLKKDGKLTKFFNLRQLPKLFSTKELEFKDFVKKHDVKFENQTGIIELIKFLEANN
jgi:hypothetical protein